MDVLDDIRTGVNRGGTYGLFGAPEQFMHHARALGARFVRVNLFWSQVEPERGVFDWGAVDTLVDQIEEDDEVWVTVCAGSPWGTRRATRFLPASPAKEPATYERFVSALVRRARGRVRFWQCEIEPNIPMLWSGAPDDYLAHLHTFHQAVKQVDPRALVALGGAVPSVMTGDEQGGGAGWIGYFDRVLAGARDRFDVFDIHPYGDPYQIPAMIDACRRLMVAHGYCKPIVASEFNGPMPTGFPGNLPYLIEALAAHRRQALGETAIPEGGPLESKAQPGVAALYERMDELPETLQMFLSGCSPELEAKRFRMSGRDIVTRTLLLLAGGVRRTAVFQLAPESPHEADTRTTRALMFGTFALTDYDGEEVGRRRPTAATVELLSHHLRGVTEVHRIDVAGAPDVYLFDIRREPLRPLIVVWRQPADFSTEDEPSVHFDWPWPLPCAHAVDAFGAEVPMKIIDGRIHLPLSSTPVLISWGSHS